MNISGYNAASNAYSYRAERASSANSKFPSAPIPDTAPTPAAPVPVAALSYAPAYIPAPAPYNPYNETHSNPQNDNGIKFMESEEEEEEKDKNEGMVDYLLKALEGKEKELRMEGNSYIDKLEYLTIHYKDLMSSVNLPQ